MCFDSWLQFLGSRAPSEPEWVLKALLESGEGDECASNTGTLTHWSSAPTPMQTLGLLRKMFMFLHPSDPQEKMPSNCRPEWSTWSRLQVGGQADGA